MGAFIAVLCAGLFTGAAGYISLVEHWARLHAGPAVALAQFRLGFPRARALQLSLAPRLVITPVYRALLEPSLAAEDPRAVELLERWGRLHHVRSVAGLLAFLTSLSAT